MMNAALVQKQLYIAVHEWRTDEKDWRVTASRFTDISIREVNARLASTPTTESKLVVQMQSDSTRRGAANLHMAVEEPSY